MYLYGRAQSLSEERAVAAMTYLESMGVSADRMETEGFGASRPLIEDSDRRKTTANRRIEIHVVEDDYSSSLR